MQGLELSRLYFGAFCYPLLKRRFPDYVERAAVGLVGEGSECLGLDDEISRDHDWGATVCLWLNSRDYARIGREMQDALNLHAPRRFRGLPVLKTDWGEGRRGVMEIGAFYYKFLGRPGPPESAQDWMSIPEAYLRSATNGEVFADPLGEFSAIREKLLAYYPEDVRRKKIAARCAAMAQAGQYNFSRCAKRRDTVAVKTAESAFLEAACGLVFLLNRQYAPFYKWRHRMLRDLPLLGSEMFYRLRILAETENADERAVGVKAEMIDTMCGLVADKLREDGLSDAPGVFLLDHARAVQTTIGDETLRGMNVLVG
ncbi:MAG: DUF4037 domain-containing protein [Desulfovibrio sp.]|jgi:hypothetical protein|nr:DUF4037 domain-containing protein [Desulfovibrio sp.]